MRTFKELYDELEGVDYDEYSLVTEEQLLDIFTEEEIVSYLKDGSIVLELDEGLLNRIKTSFKKGVDTVKKGVRKFKVVSKAMRKKIGLRMKRMMKSSTYKTKVARGKLRIASPEQQKVKAAKKAKDIVINKFYPKYKDMAVAQRVQVDQKIQQKYGPMITKLTMKQMKVVKKDEIVKVKKAKEAKKNA
jgi:hypothetical protein|tara:strand:+ start:35 stop:601 length:567 start_codon:yes stop_codon:yes gene_type:complete